MKVSFLLIILGFSQVLGRNHDSLTESKAETEYQFDFAPSDIVKPKKLLCEALCYFMSCECDEDHYEYDNSMDYFNAKSDEVQSENEDKIIELEEMVNNNVVDSEAAQSELSHPKTECNIWKTTCSSDDDCKECDDQCYNGRGAYCDIYTFRACECVDDYEHYE